MKRDRRTIVHTILRCLRLRCPGCGRASIVNKPFHIKESCSSCGVLFKREEGFFVGAILANVVATEGVILFAYLVSMPIISNHDRFVLTFLFVLAVIFPIAFYHHSWSFWLGFDHLVESLPKPPPAPPGGAYRSRKN